MAEFTLPDFNLEANIWRGASWDNFPIDGLIPPADVANVDAFLRSPLHITTLGYEWNDYLLMGEMIGFPAGTDVQQRFLFPPPNSYDVVEIPAGTGRYYTVGQVFDVAKGHDNEYRGCYAIPTYYWAPAGTFYEWQGPPWFTPYP